MMKRLLIISGLLITAAMIVSCDKNEALVSFSLPEKTKVFTMKQAGVEVAFKLSKESPFDNELMVINRSEQPVQLAAGDMKLSITGTAIVVPGIRNYDDFIKRTQRNAAILCHRAGDSYACVDQINGLAEKHLGKGFSFGVIAPGEKRRGYIIFNLPNPVTRNSLTREFKRKQNEGADLSGELVFDLHFGAVIRHFAFPVDLRISNGSHEMPIVLKSFWMSGS